MQPTSRTRRTRRALCLHRLRRSRRRAAGAVPAPEPIAGPPPSDLERLTPAQIDALLEILGPAQANYGGTGFAA